MDESTPTGQSEPPGPLGLPVGVVGAGRVGSVLGAAFRYAGYPLEAVCGSARRSPATDERIARLLPGVEVVDTPEQVLDQSLLIIVAVPDDVLPGLVAHWAGSGAVRPGQLILHTAGRHGISVLAPLAPHVVPLAVHPAMTFTGEETDLTRLRGAPFGVTSTPQARALAELLVREIGGDPVWIEEADRVRYHAALAHGCNHLVTLVAQARELLERIGIPDSAAVLRPLLEATLTNALARGDAALTGPVARGDIGTLREHLAALADAPTDLPASYHALALATAWRRATRHTGDPDRAAATFRALRAATVPGFPAEPPTDRHDTR